MTKIPVTRRQLLFIRDYTDNSLAKAMQICKEHLKDWLVNAEEEIIRRALVNLRNQIQTRWEKVSRCNNVFEERNKEWLDMQIKVPHDLCKVSDGNRDSTKAVSRPFYEYAKRTQRKKVQEAETSMTADTIPLVKAVAKKASVRGDKDISSILKAATETPTRPSPRQ